MDTSGQVAEQMVKFSIEGMGYSLKVVGSGAERLAAILMAAAKDQQKTKGKTTLNALLKSGKELTVFTIPDDQLKAFAKEAKKFCKGIMSEMYTHTIHFVILNHQYEKSTMGISKRKSTGGEWIELMPTIRLSVSVKQSEKLDDEVVSQLTNVKIVKNDFGGKKNTEIRILLGYGIVLSPDEIDYALENGILEMQGKKKISFMDKISWSSPRDLFDLYKSHNKYLPILHAKIKKAFRDDLIAMKERLKENQSE